MIIYMLMRDCSIFLSCFWCFDFLFYVIIGGLNFNSGLEVFIIGVISIVEENFLIFLIVFL